MTTIELRPIRGGLGGWELTHKENDKVVSVEWYAGYATTKDRADWFKRMDWRTRIVVIR